MYSVSLRTAENAIHDLDRILSSPKVLWHAPVGAPSTWSRAFAMRLRNAMHSARYNAPMHKHLAPYAGLFDSTIIKVIDSKTVAAINNGRATIVDVVAGETSAGLETHTIVAEVIDTPYKQVMAAFFSGRHTGTHIRIPSCELTPAELGHLAYELASHKWMVMLAYDGALTLAPDDPMVPDDAKITPAKQESLNGTD